MEYMLLAVLWGAWCFLHSLLISVKATQALRGRLGGRYRFFRLFYNLLAVVTLLPVLWYSGSLSGAPLISWRGPWRLLQAAGLGTSIWLFAAGAARYDMRQFLGLRQIREHESAAGITSSGGLDRRGILGVVRHPWYAAGILLLWSRQLDAASLTANLVLTLYFIVGAILEERKLIREFGDEYIRYREEVPMLVPLPRALRSRR